MSTATVIFQCKVCKDKMRLDFRKPTLMTAAYLNRTCHGCDTDYEIWAKVQPGTNGKGYDVESKYDKKVEAAS